MDLMYKDSLPSKEDLFNLYDELGWIEFLKITPLQLYKAISKSFFSLYVYDENKLIATGRIISDGVINAYICGLGVLFEYRNNKIGTNIMERLKAHCIENNLHIQFLCEEDLLNYYEKQGYKKFAIGMKF